MDLEYKGRIDVNRIPIWDSFSAQVLMMFFEKKKKEKKAKCYRNKKSMKRCYERQSCIRSGFSSVINKFRELDDVFRG